MRHIPPPDDLSLPATPSVRSGRGFSLPSLSSRFRPPANCRQRAASLGANTLSSSKKYSLEALIPFQQSLPRRRQYLDAFEEDTRSLPVRMHHSNPGAPSTEQGSDRRDPSRSVRQIDASPISQHSLEQGLESTSETHQQRPRWEAQPISSPGRHDYQTYGPAMAPSTSQWGPGTVRHQGTMIDPSAIPERRESFEGRPPLTTVTRQHVGVSDGKGGLDTSCQRTLLDQRDMSRTLAKAGDLAPTRGRRAVEGVEGNRPPRRTVTVVDPRDGHAGRMLGEIPHGQPPGQGRAESIRGSRGRHLMPANSSARGTSTLNVTCVEEEPDEYLYT